MATLKNLLLSLIGIGKRKKQEVKKLGEEQYLEPYVLQFKNHSNQDLKFDIFGAFNSIGKNNHGLPVAIEAVNLQLQEQGYNFVLNEVAAKQQKISKIRIQSAEPYNIANNKGGISIQHAFGFGQTQEMPLRFPVEQETEQILDITKQVTLTGGTSFLNVSIKANSTLVFAVFINRRETTYITTR